jgi:hypothetical protein
MSYLLVLINVYRLKVRVTMPVSSKGNVIRFYLFNLNLFSLAAEGRR